MTLRLFMLDPAIVFTGNVNQATFQYPLAEVTFDQTGGDTGAYTDIKDGMTVLFGSSAGADDFGRTRVRGIAASLTLYINRSPQGVRDGEIDLIDNTYITVLNDYRVWAKTPYIDADSEVTFLNETDYSDENEENYPVANAGPAHFATIDGGSIITRNFDSANSFPVADGATIDTILWDVDDGSITVGTTASAAITATFPAGFRWVSLKVTDSNGKSHTTRVAVYARDPASDTTISNFQISNHRIAQAGQRLSLKIFEPVAESTYPDGTLVMIADGEPADADDHSNILFLGWHATDPARIRSMKTAVLGDTTIDCLDVAGRLDLLPGFPTSCRIANTPDKWEEMVTPDIDKFVHQILQWYSTALDVADFFNSGTGQTYKFSIHGTEGASLWDTVARKYKAMGPDYILTCNTLGQIKCFVDPMLQDSGDRTATIQATISEADWINVAFTHRRSPTVHWLWGQAVLANDDADDIPLAFSVAPGNTPGQGDQSQEHEGLLCPTAVILYATTGHRYARANAPETTFAVNFAQGSDQAIEPANMTWVKLTITSAHAAQRGLAFTEALGLPLELRIKYNQGRTGLTRAVTMVWERETSGTPAEQWVPPVDAQVPDTDDYWDPVYEDATPSSDFFDPVKAYIVWDNAQIARTLDMLATPVVWALVDTGISGTIIDCQYVGRPNGLEKIGMWCLTSAGVFWCADIMTTTPSWTNTLSEATMQAAEVAPDSGSSRFASMFNHGARPGYAIVGTEPDSADHLNLNFPHAYFHFTDDYGATWTLQDSADELTRTTGGGTHGYMYHHKYAINWWRDTGGRIYALRNTPRQTTSVATIIMYSDDDGATWVEGATVPHSSNAWGNGSLLNPFPDTTDPLLVVTGPIGTNDRPGVFVSTDNGATVGSEIVPTGQEGFQQFSRLNSRSDTPGHIMGIGRQSSTHYWTVVQSLDTGASWTELYDSGATSPQLETPNGWPADNDIWFTLRYSNGGSVIIWMTDDNFAGGIGTDKTGNLITIFSSWASSIGGNGGVGGIALPKIGDNA